MFLDSSGEPRIIWQCWQRMALMAHVICIEPVLPQQTHHLNFFNITLATAYC
jgi:hypothetical protein